MNKLDIYKLPIISFVEDEYEGVYISNNDEIRIGKESNDYTRVLLHELCHSTSNQTRLNRHLETVSIFEHFMCKYTKDYCLEEINCEVGTYILLDYLGELTKARETTLKESISLWIDRFNKRSIEQFTRFNKEQIKEIVTYYVKNKNDKDLIDCFERAITKVYNFF